MTIDQSALLDDRYRLDERIGTGGMAEVYRATDQVLNRRVAVKVLREVHEPVERIRFVEEARTLASLDHPGLITLLDAGIQGERPYLVMTLVDDATLSSRIARGALEPAEVAAIGAQVARALAYAHRQGIVHRDVKPSNVLLSSDGRALLADFGIARLIGSTDHHTRTGDAIGSPAYLAPEQVTGDELTAAVDIYSLGLVLLEALTGQRAYPGTPVEAAVARLNAAPTMPESLDPQWRDLLARMTHRLPEDRPSAGEVADWLEGPFETVAAQHFSGTQAGEHSSGTQTGPFETVAAQHPEHTALLTGL
ncbi:MAG: serine/threonine-protein kinase, partial [Marmoricola sp.]